MLMGAIALGIFIFRKSNGGNLPIITTTTVKLDDLMEKAYVNSWLIDNTEYKFEIGDEPPDHYEKLEKYFIGKGYVYYDIKFNLSFDLKWFENSKSEENDILQNLTINVSDPVINNFNMEPKPYGLIKNWYIIINDPPSFTYSINNQNGNVVYYDMVYNFGMRVDFENNPDIIPVVITDYLKISFSDSKTLWIDYSYINDNELNTLEDFDKYWGWL